MDRAGERIARLTWHGYDVAEFLDHASEAINSAVPHHGGACWNTLDPASLLITSTYSYGWQIPSGVLDVEDLRSLFRVLIDHELSDDPMSSRAIATNVRGIQTLHEATDGDPSRSWAYEMYYEPQGVEQEVLMALRTNSGENWGTVTFDRTEGQPEFDSTELAFLRSLSPHLAEGVRRGLLIGEATDPEGPEAPGLVVLDHEGQVESLSPGVERWLSELPGFGDLGGPLPPSVLGVASQARRTSGSEANPGEVAMARVLSRSGRWTVLHGVVLSGSGIERTAVIVEPAGPARIVPLLMSVYGLTEREQDVTRLVLQGNSTAEIASTLYVSTHTVQQHLKRIFEKTGVHSRRELVGRVFFSHYEPRLLDNTTRVAASQSIRGGPFPHGETTYSSSQSHTTTESQKRRVSVAFDGPTPA